MNYLNRTLRSVVQRTFQRRHILPSIARVITAVFIFSNIAFAHKPATTLWKERKNNIQMAQLPASFAAPYAGNLSAIQSELLKQVPSVKPAFSSETRKRFSIKERMRGKSVSELPADFFSHVNIKDVYESDSKQTVVLIEDVHQNSEAQEHISKALVSFGLKGSKNPVVVGLEGANGPFAHDTYKKLSRQDIAALVADSFLKSGDISGPAHAGFTSTSKEILFWGMDDPQAYRDNVSAYKISNKSRKHTLAQIESLRNEFEKKKSTIFNSSLKAIDKSVSDYRDGKLTLSSYAKLLNGFGEAASLTFDMFVQAVEMENSLDFNRVEAERRAVIERLVRSLKEKDLHVLIDMSLAYQQGVLTFADYYNQLREICKNADIDLAETPHFDNYIRYVLLADGVDAEKLFNDISNLENAVYSKLARTNAERRLINESRQAYLMKELANFTLTSDQWALYQAGENLNGQIKMEDFEKFYSSADIRSEVMVKNTLSKMSSSRSKLGVLVSGGFHTDAMSVLLKKQKVSYVIASPKITKIDLASGSYYLSVFDREKTPLEEIFSGKKLFLALPPMGAADPLLPDTPNTAGPLGFTALINTAANEGRVDTGDVEVVNNLGVPLKNVTVRKSVTSATVEANIGGRRIKTVVTNGAAPSNSRWSRLLGRRVIGQRQIGPDQNMTVYAHFNVASVRGAVASRLSSFRLTLASVWNAVTSRFFAGFDVGGAKSRRNAVNQMIIYLFSVPVWSIVYGLTEWSGLIILIIGALALSLVLTIQTELLSQGMNGKGIPSGVIAQLKHNPDYRSGRSVMYVDKGGVVNINKSKVEHMPHWFQRWISWHESVHKNHRKWPEFIVTFTDFFTLIPALIGYFPKNVSAPSSVYFVHAGDYPVKKSPTFRALGEAGPEAPPAGVHAIAPEDEIVASQADHPSVPIHIEDQHDHRPGQEPGHRKISPLNKLNAELSEIDGAGDIGQTGFTSYDYRSKNPDHDLTGALGAARAVGFLNEALKRTSPDVLAKGDRPLVIVARDARKTSPLYQTAGVNGLLAAGAEVIDLGAVKPNHIAEYFFALNYYYSQHGQERPVVGFFYTASHVQGHVGGIKAHFGSKTGITSLTGAEVKKDWPEAVRNVITGGIRLWNGTAYVSPTVEGTRSEMSVRLDYLRWLRILGGGVPQENREWDYLKKYRDSVAVHGLYDHLKNIAVIDPNAKSLSGLRILIDTGHAAAGLTAPTAFRQLGAEVVELHTDVHEIGEEHRADPSRADLRQAAIDYAKDPANGKFDVVVLYDLDGDRGQLNVVMPDGNIVELTGDMAGALLAPVLAASAPEGKQLVAGYDVKSSGALTRILKALDFLWVEAKTGYPNVKQAIYDLVAKSPDDRHPSVFIEKSGHIGLDLTFMLEDPTVVALLILRRAGMTAAGLPALIREISTHSSTNDIRPKLHPRLFSGNVKFSDAAERGLAIIKNSFVDKTFQLPNPDGKGEPVVVKGLISNEIDRLKLKFIDPAGEDSEIAWVNFRFSANDGTWSVVVDGVSGPLIQPIVRLVLETIRDEELADFTDAKWAGREEVVRSLGEKNMDRKLVSTDDARQTDATSADLSHAPYWADSILEMRAARADVFARRTAELLGKELLLQKVVDDSSGEMNEVEIPGVTYDLSHPRGVLVRFADGSWVMIKVSNNKKKLYIYSSPELRDQHQAITDLIAEKLTRWLPHSSIDNSEEPRIAIRKMLENAAALIGVGVSDLSDKRKLAEAVDVYNAHVGGLDQHLKDRDLKEAEPTPTEIPAEASDEANIEFLKSVAKGERAWILFAGGRATRMKLPAEFDELGIAGLTDGLLTVLKGLDPEGDSKSVEQRERWYRYWLDRAIKGDVYKGNVDLALRDFSFVQRDLLEMWYQIEVLASNYSQSGVSAADVLKGVNFVVTVNSANREAIQRQLAALKFPGKIKVIEQPEVGGLTGPNAQGETRWDETNLFPEGHGEPFIAMAIRPSKVFAVSPDGMGVPLYGTLKEALSKDGAKHFMFAQINDLHLLGNMTSVERWEIALREMRDHGAQFVMEMVENVLGQKGGGTFTKDSEGNVMMRDTLVMKRPHLARVTTPKSLSRMFYFGSVEALEDLSWNSIPAYLNVRGSVVTRELYSGDVSSALKARTIQQKGVGIHTVKMKSRIPVALGDIKRQDEQPGFKEFVDRVIRDASKPSVPSASAQAVRAPVFEKETDRTGPLAPITASTTKLPPQEELGVLRGFLARLLRIQSKRSESGIVPLVTIISDQHGAIDKFDSFILNAIRRVVGGDKIPPEFRLNPDQKIDPQLAPFGVQLSDLKGKLYIHNMGDFMDRGPYGVKVYRRSFELIMAGLSDFVIGNHDLWMFLNLMAYHLPWYSGYDFYGYSDDYDSVYGNVQDLVEEHRAKTAALNSPSWWAERLAEYTAYHDKNQKNYWTPVIDPQVKEIFSKVEASVGDNAEHIELWNKLRGFYLIDIYTGSRAVGHVSLKWWQDLHREFKQASALLPDDIPFEVRESWARAVKLMDEEIIHKVREDLEDRLKQGHWVWRVFEAINYQNYTSVEWWGKDWVFHKGRGASVLEELNEGVADDSKKGTPGNYLDNDQLKEIADFFKSYFALYTRDIYQNTYIHGFLPIDYNTGEFFFRYKDVEYRGKGGVGEKSVWEGLDEITEDIRSATDLSAIHDALALVNSWYADNTTIANPQHVVSALRNIGAKKILGANGVKRLFMAHTPIMDYTKKEAGNRGEVTGFMKDEGFFLTDHGMGERFEGRGASIIVNPNGVVLSGYERMQTPATDEPVANPNTIGSKKDENEAVFVNNGLPEEVFLPRLIGDVRDRIKEVELEVNGGDDQGSSPVVLQSPIFSGVLASMLVSVGLSYDSLQSPLLAANLMTIAGIITAAVIAGGLIVWFFVRSQSDRKAHSTTAYKTGKGPVKPVTPTRASAAEVETEEKIDPEVQRIRDILDVVSTDTRSSRAMVESLLLIGPHRRVIGNLSANDVRKAIARGLRFNPRQSEEVRAEVVAVIVAYLEAVRKGQTRAVFELADELARKQEATNIVTVYNVGQVPEKIEQDVANLRSIVDRVIGDNSLTHRPITHDLVIVLHQPDQIQLAKVTEIVKQSPRFAAVWAENVPSSPGGVKTYNNVLDLAQKESGDQLKAVRALIEGNLATATLRTYDRVPGQFRADGLLRSVWTLLMDLGSGWVFIPIQDTLKAAAIAAIMA